MEEEINNIQDTIQLLEEIQTLDIMCPYCNGIILWRRGRPMYKNKKTGENKVIKGAYKYTCRECGKYFQTNKTNPKLRGAVAKFVMNNINIINPRDLSELVHKYFKIQISAQTIYILKKRSGVKL